MMISFCATVKIQCSYAMFDLLNVHLKTRGRIEPQELYFVILVS
uniref:Uncharacterized protein n=1 Tax=Arundo donax TaxID=35708 RepID=A0A0A9GKS1_ARUDO